jgi:hypothetical protein
LAATISEEDQGLRDLCVGMGAFECFLQTTPIHSLVCQADDKYIIEFVLSQVAYIHGLINNQWLKKKIKFLIKRDTEQKTSETIFDVDVDNQVLQLFSMNLICMPDLDP